MLKPTLLILTALIATFLPLQALALKYSVCEPEKSLAEVKDVKVSDCDGLQDACPFVRGFNKSIELDFMPKQKVEQVKVKVAGKLNALPVPFHVNPDNACGNYGFNCPLDAGKPYKFQLTLPILRTYPKINVDVFVRLVDEKGDILACVEMPARIQEPQKV